MVIRVNITDKVIEWVSQETGMDEEEAREFVSHFVGVLYMSGAFELVSEPASSANIVISEDEAPGK